MHYKATDGNTDRIEGDEATFAVALPDEHTHRDGDGFDTLLGPVTVDADDSRMYDIARDAIEEAFDRWDVITVNPMQTVTVWRLSRFEVADFTARDVKAYRDRDIEHLAKYHDLKHNHVYRTEKPLRFAVEIPGDGRDGVGTRRLNPNGSIRAPYLVGPITIPETNGVMKEDAQFDAAYRGFDLSDHSLRRVEDTESTPVYRVHEKAGDFTAKSSTF